MARPRSRHGRGVNGDRHTLIPRLVCKCGQASGHISAQERHRIDVYRIARINTASEIGSGDGTLQYSAHACPS
jgi:hypothetical protein